MLLLILSHIVQAAEGKRPDRDAEIKKCGKSWFTPHGK
jgi:hypothetical protein